MTAPLDDEFTELVDADIPRVDLVDKAANGTRFLIAKQAGGARGLLEPAFVRDLITKADPGPAPTGEEQVTMTGSPAAIARMIHEAAVAKAKYDTDDRQRMAGSGVAMDDGSYPIADRADLDRAIHAVGRGGAEHDAIRRHIIRRADALGAASEIPDNWNADGSLKGSVAKEMQMADDDLDPTAILAEPDSDAPGQATNPGSPAWEAVDAATARKWTSILARARAAIDLLADREMLESASGDDDIEQACSLQDACCAIDYAISILAPFAVAEQAEADCGDEMMAVGKALAGWDPAPLDVIEALGRVRKAGRVLSSANEAAIRGAVESLQKVLASLPAAPAADDPVAKDTKVGEDDAMPEPKTSADTVAENGQVPMMGVAKADGEKAAMRAVYDAKGRLVGIVDPADITPIEDAGPADDDGPGDGPGEDAAGKPEGGETGTPAETPDLQPAPAGEVGTPADAVPADDTDDGDGPDDDVTKTTTNDSRTTDSEVLKSIADVVKAQLDAYSATQQDLVAKQVAQVAEMAETIETLKTRLRAVEEQPAEPKVFTNGAVPPAHLLRGQDRGAPPVDVTKAAELKKSLYLGSGPEQKRAADDMQAMAIAQLEAIRRGER